MKKTSLHSKFRRRPKKSNFEAYRLNDNYKAKNEPLRKYGSINPPRGYGGQGNTGWNDHTNMFEPEQIYEVGGPLYGPLYAYLRDNYIARTKLYINQNATGVHDITLTSTGLKCNIAKGTKLWIYDVRTWRSIQVRTKTYHKTGDTTLVCDNFNLKKGLNSFRPQSYIVLDVPEQVGNRVDYARYEIPSAAYKTLASNPYELLPAITDHLHIPISCTILYNRTADEMTRSDLFVGHGRSSTIGQYWGGLKEAFYRSRDKQHVELTAMSYSPSFATDYTKKPYINLRSNNIGNALELYGTTNFTSSNSLTLLLFFKTIKV